MLFKNKEPPWLLLFPNNPPPWVLLLLPKIPPVLVILLLPKIPPEVVLLVPKIPVVVEVLLFPTIVPPPNNPLFELLFPKLKGLEVVLEFWLLLFPAKILLEEVFIILNLLIAPVLFCSKSANLNSSVEAWIYSSLEVIFIKVEFTFFSGTLFPSNLNPIVLSFKLILLFGKILEVLFVWLFELFVNKLLLLLLVEKKLVLVVLLLPKIELFCWFIFVKREFPPKELLLLFPKRPPGCCWVFPKRPPEFPPKIFFWGVVVGAALELRKLFPGFPRFPNSDIFK